MSGPARRIIGLETSSEVCGVALLELPSAVWRTVPCHAGTACNRACRTGMGFILSRARVREREAGGDGARHSEVIYRLLDRVLGPGKRPNDADLVCVSLGPGSFTGLRVGLAVAKTLGRFFCLPVVGVPTLKAIAFQASVGKAASLYAPVMDAKRGEIYAAAYRSSRTGMREVRRVRLLEREALTAWLPRGAKVLEEGRPHAWAVAALGAAEFLSRGADDPVRLVPYYVQRPEAVEKLLQKRRRKRRRAR